MNDVHGDTTKPQLQDSCLVCGEAFDATHEPVIECRGVRVCSVCRSRSNFRKFFVIERYVQAKGELPQYACLFGWGDTPKILEWTEDLRCALQFSREEDAGNFANLYQKEFCLAKVRELLKLESAD